MGQTRLRQLCRKVWISVMGLLNKAKAKVPDSPKKKAKGVAWVAGNNEGDKVAQAVKELVAIDAQMKALTAKSELFKTVVKKFAHDRFVGDFTSTGVLPETPMTVQTEDGEKVTYVVQDRSSQYKIGEDQLDALRQLLGEDVAKEITYEETTYSFSRTIMALPGVSEAIDEALTGVVEKLTSGDNPVLTQDQADVLIEASEKLTFAPGTLDRIPQLVGRDAQRVRQMIEIMGSCCTRYVKT